MNTERKRRLGNTFLLALAAVGIAQACSKDAAPVDAPIIEPGNGGSSGTGGTGGKAGTAGTDNPGGDGSGGAVGTGGSTGTGGGSGKGGGAGKGGTGGTGTGADGGSGNEGGETSDCVRNPTAPEDFSIRCTDSRCAPFDNFARIPGFDGTLPDL